MKRIALVLGTVIVLIALLFASALIPRAAIKEHAAESAGYICDKGMFPLLIPKMQGTLLHYYADALLLNIACHFDETDPVRSVLEAGYYDEAFVQVDREAYLSATEDLPCNKEYIRYWHGSLILVRPLLTVMNIQGMQVLFGIVIAVLLAVLCVKLWRKKEKGLLFALLAGFILTTGFLTSLVLEYTWCTVLTLTFSILALRLEERQKEESLLTLFALCGILTNFFDFLTVETLTLLVPLLLTVAIRHKKGAGTGQLLLFSIEAALLWGLGYAGMWLLKWLLAGAVLGRSPAEFLNAHISERGSGTMNLGFMQYTLGAIFRNLSVLLPQDIPVAGYYLFAAMVIAYLYFLYVHHKDEKQTGYVLLILALSLVPYLRYTVMRAHSYDHYFFTYRAQWATVLGLGILLKDTASFKKGGESLQETTVD